jgi:hypothetical protein
MNIHRSKKIFWFLLFVVVFLIISRNILLVPLAYGDFTPFSTNWSALFNTLIYTWNQSFTGQFEFRGLFYFLRLIFEIISFNNNIIAQDIFIFTVLSSAVFSMFYLLKKLNLSNSTAMICSLFFLINPVTSNEFSNGINDIFILYALIPLTAAIVLEILNKYNFTKGFIFSLIISLNLMNTQTAFWNLMIIPVLIFAYSFTNGKVPYKQILYIFFHFIVGILINIFFLFSFFNVINNFASVSYLETFKDTYRFTQFLNLYRLIGNSGSSQEILGYYTQDIYYYLSFVFFGLIIYYVTSLFKLKPKNIDERVLIFSVIIVIFIYSAFMNLIGSGYFDSLIINKNVFLVSLRNPQKLFYLFTFSYIVLLSLSISFLEKKLLILGKRKLYYLILSLMILIWIGQNIHFFSGDFGQRKIRKESYYITEKYSELSKILSSLNKNSKVLILPFDYTTQLKTVWGNNIVKNRMGGNMYGNGSTFDKVTDIYKNICTKEDPFNDVDKTINIDYIVLDKNPESYLQKKNTDCALQLYYDTPYIWGTYDYFNSLFSSLKVYFENDHFVIYARDKEHVSEFFTFNKLISFDSIQGIGSKLQFVDKNIKLNTTYYLENDSKFNKNNLRVENPYDTVSYLDINTENKTITKKFIGKRNVYTDPTKSDLLFYFSNNRMEFYSIPGYGFKVNGRNLLKENEKKVLKTIEVDGSLKYYLKRGNNVSLIKKDTVIDIGKLTGNIEILETKENLIKNPSFESGSWQENVGNCMNDGKSKDDLKMTLDDSSKADGSKSLRLESRLGVACTNTSISIHDPGNYILSFDYQSKNANHADFHFELNDQIKTTIKDSLIIENKDWKTYQKLIYIPNNVSIGTLYLYSFPGDPNQASENLYDNIILTRVTNTIKVDIPLTSNYYSFGEVGSSGTNTIEYFNTNYTYANKIPNNSFELGTWQKEVGDCNNYDNNPKISMNLNTQDKTDGDYSLQLEAKNHIACSYTKANINSANKLLFNFDYKTPYLDTAEYYIGFNDDKKTSISERLSALNKSWMTYSKTINPPTGSDLLSIYIYANQHNTNKNAVTLYDNFKLFEVPDLSSSLYLVDKSNYIYSNPKNIISIQLRPTKYKVEIHGVTTPFYFGSGIGYHPQWQAKLNNKKVNGFFKSWIPWVTPDAVPDDYHFKLDGFLNGWYIDPAELCATVKSTKLKVESNSNRADELKVDPNPLVTRNSQLATLKPGCTINSNGSYDIELVIEFVPQRWFYVGLLISGATLLSCIGYLGYDFVRRKSRSKVIRS